MGQLTSWRNMSASLHSDERGQNMLEFAVTFLLVITLIFIMVEGFSMIHAYTVLADAANEGLRFYSVNSGNPSGAQTVAQNYAANTLHDISAITVSCGPTVSGTSVVLGTSIQCSIAYTYVPYLSNFLSNPPTMHAYAQGTAVN